MLYKKDVHHCNRIGNFRIIPFWNDLHLLTTKMGHNAPSSWLTSLCHAERVPFFLTNGQGPAQKCGITVPISPLPATPAWHVGRIWRLLLLFFGPLLRSKLSARIIFCPFSCEWSHGHKKK